GGLVARTFIKTYPERWKSMGGKESDVKAKRGGKLVMLGTPNHGSFTIPQVITGVEPIVKKLALLDVRHNLPQLLKILNTFVGSYQMLPSSLVMKSVEPLYKSETYRKFNLNVPQRHLDNASEHHKLLSKVIDPHRMVYIAGCNQPTFCSIEDWKR